MKVRFLFIGYLHGSEKKNNQNTFYAVGHLLNKDGVPSCSLTWVQEDLEYLKTLKPLSVIDLDCTIDGRFINYTIIRK